MRDDYSRSVSLACQTCGCEEFEHDEETATLRCTDCGLQISHNDLKEANSDRIEAVVEEMKADVMDDMQKRLKRAFSKWK